MPKASALKKGSLVELNGAPHTVEDLRVQTPSARGGASLYKVRFRNLVNGHKVDGSYRGDDVFKDIDIDRRDVQFSYTQQDSYVFMDLEDYSEIALSAADLEAQIPYLTEGLEGITALTCDGRVLTIELPDVVELDITQCDPTIRGATAAARTKPATLSTGLTVQVPEYMSSGERIRVDTRTGEFLSRA